MAKTPEGPIPYEAYAQLPPLESVFKTDGFEVLTGTSNPQLARAVGAILKKTVDEPVSHFPNRETNVQISPNLRGKEVYIIQSTSDPANDHVMELVLMSSAAIRASAKEVTAVIPYYGYGRQDRKDKPRVTISAADVADMLKNAGVHRIFTIDLHAEQTESALKGPWDNLYGSSVLLPAIKDLNLKDVIIVAPDVGASKRAPKISFLAGGSGEIAIIYKIRKGPGESESPYLLGEVDGRDVVIVDDEIQTGGTIADGARLLKDKGANRIIVAATHGVLISPALERLNDDAIEKVFITDTIAQPEEVQSHPKIEILSVAPLVAEAIKRMHSGGSLSELIPTSR